MNILTPRQRCDYECQYTHWRTSGQAMYGDARKCKHGRWWVATGRAVPGTVLDKWRPPTLTERIRIRTLAKGKQQ